MSDTPRAAPSPNYKWWVVGMLWFFCFFNYADRQAISSIFPILHDQFGFTASELGLIGSIFAWMYAAGSPFAGFIGDRLSRKGLILGGCVFWSVATVATSWCGKLWQFLTVRLLQGSGETFYYPSAASLMSDYHDGKTRSFAFSLHQSSVYIGTIGGGWAGAWIAQNYGWRAAFYFFGFLGIVLAVVFSRLLREPVRGAMEPAGTPKHEALPVGATLKVIFSKPTAVLLMAAFLCANLVAVNFLVWTPKFLVDKFHFNLAAAGLNATIYIQLASACSGPCGGWLADVFSRRIAGGRILVQAIGLVVGATFVGMVGLTESAGTLIVAMTLFGLCKGLYDSNIFAALYDVVEPRARATAAGIMNSVGWCGGALGPVAIGLFTQYYHGGKDQVANMSKAIASGSVLYVAGAVFLLVAAFRTVKGDALRHGGGVAPVPAV